MKWYFNYETKIDSRWGQDKVLMSKSLNHSCNWFVRMVALFTASESRIIESLICSETLIHSGTKCHCTVCFSETHNGSAGTLFGTKVELKQTILCLKCLYISICRWSWCACSHCGWILFFLEFNCIWMFYKSFIGTFWKLLYVHI